MPEDYVISAPLASPGPGRPFVDRENELRLVESKLEEDGIRGGQMRSCVICFWGAYGMGKSWLLKKLEEKYYSASINRSVSHPTIAVRLDLSRHSTKSLWHETRIKRELIIRELWKQLATQLGDDAPAHSLASPDEWAKDFVSTVTKWALASCTPLIMLDTVDDLIDTNDDDFGWLEEHLIEPLAITNRVLFIFTSRGEIKNWKCFQVRRRIDSHRLSAFDVNTAAKAVQADPAISRELSRHSFGHPLSTERLATLLEKNLNLDLQKASAFKKPLNPRVMRAILKQVDEEILRVFDEPFRPIARAVSVLRWISVEPLRFLAKKMNRVERARGAAGRQALQPRGKTPGAERARAQHAAAGPRAAGVGARDREPLRQGGALVGAAAAHRREHHHRQLGAAEGDRRLPAQGGRRADLGADRQHAPGGEGRGQFRGGPGLHRGADHGATGEGAAVDGRRARHRLLAAACAGATREAAQGLAAGSARGHLVIARAGLGNARSGRARAAAAVAPAQDGDGSRQCGSHHGSRCRGAGDHLPVELHGGGHGEAQAAGGARHGAAGAAPHLLPHPPRASPHVADPRALHRALQGGDPQAENLVHLPDGRHAVVEAGQSRILARAHHQAASGVPGLAAELPGTVAHDRARGAAVEIAVIEVRRVVLQAHRPAAEVGTAVEVDHALGRDALAVLPSILAARLADLLAVGAASEFPVVPEVAQRDDALVQVAVEARILARLEHVAVALEVVLVADLPVATLDHEARPVAREAGFEVRDLAVHDMGLSAEMGLLVDDDFGVTGLGGAGEQGRTGRHESDSLHGISSIGYGGLDAGYARTVLGGSAHGVAPAPRGCR